LHVCAVGQRQRAIGENCGRNLRPALEKALATNGPVLVDVVTDANVLSMPPKATIQQAKGFALAMTKMAFTGELKDVTDTVMANWRYL
jgi:pyruvate dehydrogenase (quinone)